MQNTNTHIHWLDKNNASRSARWHSEAHAAPPRKVVCVDDTISTDTAYRLACEGTGLLWCGDFQNARHLLQALARRLDKAKKPAQPSTPFDAFHKHRAAQIHRARILSMVLIELNADYSIELRRAPDVREACAQAFGSNTDAHVVMSLKNIQGAIGAFEWRKKGVFIDALNDMIYPHYGVFSPVRGEYIELIARARLPAHLKLAFEIGVGTGVLSAVLARRGVAKIIATDQDACALDCALENLTQLDLLAQVELQNADLFPNHAGKAQLIVCNPPWLPAKANAPIEHAVYDPNSQMLKGFLNGVKTHLDEQGQAWLIMSDLAEHLTLRSREDLLGWIEAAGLRVLDKLDVSPKHKKNSDKTDALHSARAKEVTSLWVLGVATIE